MWPHRRQPTRLLRPWDSPGKSTGVGCHFLLQCMKVKSESEVAQSCLTLSNPMDCSLPGSSIHGIFQARVLEWSAIAFSGHISLDSFNLKYFLSHFLPLLTLMFWGVQASYFYKMPINWIFLIFLMSRVMYIHDCYWSSGVFSVSCIRRCLILVCHIGGNVHLDHLVKVICTRVVHYKVMLVSILQGHFLRPCK